MQDFFFYDKCQYIWKEAYTSKKNLTTLQALLAKNKTKKHVVYVAGSFFPVIFFFP